MFKSTFGMSLASVSLVLALLSPTAFASGGSSTGGGGTGGGGGSASGGGGGDPAGSSSSNNSSALCLKVSGQAVAAFSYYTVITLSDNIQNCSAQDQTVATTFVPGPGASPACVAALANAQTAFVLIPTGGRATQQRTMSTFGGFSCSVGDPIFANVVTHSGQVLASAPAGWVTGVTP